MKRLILRFISAAVTLFCMTSAVVSCTENVPSEDDGRLSIVTTCFPPYDFARAVTGGEADITMLLCPGAEAHSYEPTPLDMVKIQQCDVFIYIGGEGEVWADKILSSLDTEDMTVIRLFDYAEPLEEEAVAGASPSGHSHDHHSHSHDAEEEDAHHDDEDEEDSHDGHSHDGTADYSGYDEHIWTSLHNAEKCIEGIEHELSERLPESAEDFEKNAQSYIAQLQALDREFEEMAENAPSDVILIGDRFPFRYLTHDYGLEYFAAFSGCSSESEPGVYTMAFLIDEIKAHELDTVFYLEFSTKRVAQKLSDATGAEMLPLHSCHNVSEEDMEKGTTYAGLMRQNLNNLREALY